MASKELYFKAPNAYGENKFWSYAKVIKHEFFGEETCQTFSFTKTSRDHHFEIGDEFFKGFGFLDTNKYNYYCDLGEMITKEEFEKELKIFIEKLNKHVNETFKL